MINRIIKSVLSTLLVSLLIVVSFAQSATVGATINATQSPVFLWANTSLLIVTLSTIECHASVDSTKLTLDVTCWDYATSPNQLNTNLILMPPSGVTISTFEVGPDKLVISVDSSTKRFTMTGGGQLFMSGY